MTLREQIAEEMNEAMERAIQLERGGVMSRAEADPHADCILELVRTALLSDEAVVAGSKEIVRFKWANAPEAVARAVIESNVAAAGLGGTTP